MKTGLGTTRAESERRHRRTTAIVIVIIALLILAVLGGLAVFIFKPFPSSSDDGSTPAEAVRAYLTALSQGDATLALSYSAQQPGDSTFTTNEFFSALMQANPMTDINVPERQTTASPAVITATYTLGSSHVEARFTVQRHEQGWLLDSGFVGMNLDDLISRGISVTLNDIDITQMSKVYLLPGVYTFGTKDPMLVATAPLFILEYPESNPWFAENFSLSEEGISRIAAAAEARLTHCLSLHELIPVGCGFAFSGGEHGTVNPDTARWTLEDDAPDFVGLAYQLDTSVYTRVEANITIKIGFEGVSVDKSQMFSGTVEIIAMNADFQDPDNIVVTFI